MKTVIYFILSICAIVYIAALSTLQICGAELVASWGTIGTILAGIATYGGIALILLFARVNFFGNPIKVVFFILLILAAIFYVVSCAAPGLLQGLFGIGG